MIAGQTKSWERGIFQTGCYQLLPESCPESDRDEKKLGQECISFHIRSPGRGVLDYRALNLAIDRLALHLQ